MRTTSSTLECFEFIKKKCTKNIRSLIFDFGFGDYQITDAHMDIISAHIDNLHALALDPGLTCDVRWDRFQNLRILYSQSEQVTWMTGTFPNLNTLCLSNIEESHRDDLTNFFPKNKQIETVSASDLIVIECISSSNINLTNFIVHFIQKNGKEMLANTIEKYYDKIDNFDLCTIYTHCTLCFQIK